MKNITKNVKLDRYSKRKDKSVSLTFITVTKQTSDDIKHIDEFLDHQGVFYFKSSGQLTPEEIKAIEDVELEVEGKTKSQRLRNTIYKVWETTKEKCSFQDYYIVKIEKIINHFKGQIINED